MRFGKQLQLGTYEPWKAYYIEYDKLKRLIRKKRFVLDDKESENDGTWKGLRRDFSMLSSINLLGYSSKESTRADEFTPLRTNTLDSETYGGTAKRVTTDNYDFFSLIQQEIDKVNKFFIGKLAEIRISLDQITSKRRNVYLSHHTSAETDLVRLREIYVELAALRSYCDLNQTGKDI